MIEGDRSHFREPNTFVRRFGAVGLAIVFLGGLPVLASRLGFDFLPSSAWLSSSKWIARLIAVATMVIIFFGLYRRQIREYSVRRTQILLFVMLASPLMSYPLAINAVQVGFPFLYTVFFGSEGKQNFIVDETDRVNYGRRGCRYPVILRDMPTLHRKLCDIDSDVRSSLGAGMKIEVVGRSSYFGVFLMRARIEG